MQQETSCYRWKLPQRPKDSLTTNTNTPITAVHNPWQLWTLYLGVLLRKCVENMIQTSYMCHVLLNGAAVNTATQTENAWLSLKHGGYNF